MTNKTEKPVEQQAEPQTYPGVRLRIFLGGAHHDEIFITEKPGVVPPEVQNFVNLFLAKTDTVWTPNPSKLRGYMIRNLAGYQIDQVTVNRNEANTPAEEPKAE